MSKKSLVLSSIIALSLVVGSTASAATTAQAKPHAKGNPEHALMATLVGTDGTTLTVTAKGKDSAVTTVDASNAKILVSGATSDVTKLKNGDKLIILGTINGASVTASRISDGSGSSKNTGMLNGTITAIDGNTISVSVPTHSRSPKGAKGISTPSAPATNTVVTVTTDTKTAFSVAGKKSASITDLTVGSRVMVVGVDSTTGAGTAHLVNVMPTMAPHAKKAK